MPQYLLAVWHDADVEFDPSVPPTPEQQKMFDDTAKFNDDAIAAGVFVHAGGLQPKSTATTIRPDGEQTTIADGPYTTATQQMGGFWIIDVPDRDTALDWARRGAIACGQVIEVRAFHG